MKATRKRTLRGSITHASGELKRKLIIDDGRTNYGLKVLEFHVWADLSHQSAFGSFGLALDVVAMPASDIFDAGDNRQIAWATWGYADAISYSMDLPQFNLVDPDHVVNRDLYFFGKGSHEPVVWNYMIVCEEYILSDDEAIVQIIKETSQNTSP